MRKVVKRIKLLASCLLFIAVAVVVAFGVFKMVGAADSNHKPGKTNCSLTGRSYTVTIQGNKADPEHIDARLCDRLTIINRDNASRLIAFGLHEHHEAYDGVTERLLSSGQSFGITLNQTGNFRFHDHLQDEVQGTFTVK